MAKAIIFDFNGVIISDENYHRQSWRIFTKQLGFNLTEDELNKKVFGHRESEVFPYLFKKDIPEKEIEKFSRQRNEIVYDLEGKFIPVPGVVEFIDELKKNNFPLGLATNSRRDYMNKVLKEFKLNDAFKTIVTAEDVTVGKPDPEIYLKTAQNLDTKPEDCLVFEDSILGIEAAHSAGMKVIALTTTREKNSLPEVYKVINNFTEISPKDLP